MAIPTLVLGLGGTGKQIVLRVKERLIEVYGAVPEDKKLFLLDTDVYGGAEYNGVKLLEPGDRLPANNTAGYRDILDGEAEFYHVSNQGGRLTLDQVLPDCTGPEFDWIDEKAINKTITSAADRVIARGAGTVRQVGKLALYLDYNNVYNELQSRLLEAWDSFQNYQTHPDANFSTYRDQSGNEVVVQRKLNVFVASSVAGGSGAGMIVDVLRMIEAIIQCNTQLQQNMIQVITLLVGGKVITGDNSLALGNTYAALRELERLGGVPGQPLAAAVPPRVFAPAPVGMRENPMNPSGIIFLFDQPNRQGMTLNRNAAGGNRDLEDATYPSVADLIIALSDDKIGALFDSGYPDIKNAKMRRFKNINGYFPFCSAGIHTIIFPEQDIRKSAGFELLTRFWSEYLVRTANQEESDPYGEDLDPVTLDLWNAPQGEPIPPRITPNVFTEVGFRRTYICKGVPSPRFIQAVVRAALRKDKKIELPPKDKFLALFGGKTNVERVMALIGVEKADEKITSINDYIQQSIDDISQCEDFDEIQRWKLHFLGSGPWGTSRFEDLFGVTKNDTWLGKMKHEIIGTGDIRAQFRQSLEAVVVAILNDKTPAYRLEYAWRVLRRLVELSRSWWVAADELEHTVLELNFSKEYQKTGKALKNISKTENEGRSNFTPYRNAVREYAKAYGELVAVDLLKFLCKELEAAAESVIQKLNGAREYQRDIHAILVQQKKIHESNREKKEKIDVRKYVTDLAFEKQLTEGPVNEGIEKCKLAMESSFHGGEMFWWKLPFFRNLPAGADINAPTETVLRSIAISKDELVARAVRWACTCTGNPDRNDEDGKPIFANLGRSVRMADRVMQHIGQGRENDLAQRMVGTQYLASRCPIQRSWPADRLLHFMAMPEFGADAAQDNQFYRTVNHGIQASMNNYDKRWYHTNTPANPRAAVAFEIATGFKLEHLDGMDDYRAAYLNEVDHGHALHCLPEERNASISYETAFHVESQQKQIYRTPEELVKLLYGTVNVAGRQLDPIVVDVLGNKDRIELFIKGLVTRVIGLPAGGIDYAMILPGGVLRLSQMSNLNQTNNILSQLTQGNQSKIPQLAANQVLVARLRMMYALRVFVVAGKGWVEDKGKLRPAEINYEEATKKITEEEQKLVVDKDKPGPYAASYNTFLKWFTDYEDDADLKPLADMGLVLARIAWDLNNIKPGSGGENANT